MALRGFRHIGLKILALALAAMLWLVVSGEQIVERALRIPLEFTNLPARLELVGDPDLSHTAFTNDMKEAIRTDPAMGLRLDVGRP